MTESLINEWLADCADISTTELQTFAKTLSQDNEVVRALYMLLEERSKYSEVNSNNYLDDPTIYHAGNDPSSKNTFTHM